MNIKNSILAAALVLGVAGAASAQNVTYIAGSTAFRGAANAAMTNYCATHGGGLLAYDNATVSKAGHLLLNYTNGSGTQYIAATWNGSEAGIQSCAGPANGQSNAATFSFYATNATNLSTTYAVTHTATVDFSDTYQGTSVFTGNLRLNNGATVNYASLQEATASPVGVVAFTFVGSKNIPTNAQVTTENINQLAASGNVPLTLLTGSSADQTNSAFFIGRNIDSGTRLSMLAEVGYGVRTSLSSYAVASGYTGGAASNTTATLTGVGTNSLISYPTEVINGVSTVNAGNSGYSSGGTLCGLFTNQYAFGTGLSVNGAAPVRTGTNFLVGYAGVSDASGNVANGLVYLPYNGQAYSTNNIAQGLYTFWSYEHLFISPNATVTDNSLAQALANAINGSTTATLNPNVSINDMQCGRNGDGQTVYSYYP
jgi:hypothetical protein